MSEPLSASCQRPLTLRRLDLVIPRGCDMDVDVPRFKWHHGGVPCWYYSAHAHSLAHATPPCFGCCTEVYANDTVTAWCIQVFLHWNTTERATYLLQNFTWYSGSHRLAASLTRDSV